MANYNLTNYTNATNLLEIATESNNLTGGMLGPLILVLTFAVSFVGLKNFSSVDAFLASSAITATLGGGLWVVGLVGETALLVAFTVFMLSVVVHFVAK